MPHDPTPTASAGPRETYETPAVVYESELEVRAGSPLGLPDPLDPLGMQP